MLLLLAMACGEPVHGLPGPSLDILSPADDAVLRVGHPLTLEVEYYDEYQVMVDTVAVEWTLGDWSATGNPVHLDEGLPYGDHELTARLDEPDGTRITAYRSFVVRQLLDEVAFEGILTMDIHMWSSEYGDFDFVCEHDALGFTITPEGAMVGQGSCTSPLGQEVFTLDGTLDGLAVGGTLTTTSDETDEAMVFDGTLDEAMHVSATYDETFITPDKKGSLRLYGGFEADAVPEG